MILAGAYIRPNPIPPKIPYVTTRVDTLLVNNESDTPVVDIRTPVEIIFPKPNRVAAMDDIKAAMNCVEEWTDPIQATLSIVDSKSSAMDCTISPKLLSMP